MHGYAGFLGVVVGRLRAVGLSLLARCAARPRDGAWATVTPWGQFVGAVIMFFVLGFVPGYVLSWVLKQVGLLRIPREVELAGLDYLIHATAVREDDELRAVLDRKRAARPPGRPGAARRSLTPAE